jgi:hypothetical protein
MGKRSNDGKAMKIQGKPGKSRSANPNRIQGSPKRTSEAHTLASIPNTGPGIKEVNAALKRQAKGTKAAKGKPLFR